METSRLLNAARRFVERATGLKIFRKPPRGADLLYDLQSDLGSSRIDLVFDVGANIGQSVSCFLGAFKNADFYCFEPVSETFQLLKANVKAYDRVQCFQLAFGAAPGMGEMIRHAESVNSFMSCINTEDSRGRGGELERVTIDTLDAFCNRHGIDLVSFLKIDTEGSDLDVLKGAEQMLTAQRVSLVQVEAGMNKSNRRHVPFEELKSHLEARGYSLFGIYDQIREWPSNDVNLRRVNAVFLSAAMIRANRRPQQ